MEKLSADGSTIRLSWFNNGADAVVHIVRKKEAVTFRMTRDEAETLRAFLPADQPDSTASKAQGA